MFHRWIVALTVVIINYISVKQKPRDLEGIFSIPISQFIKTKAAIGFIFG